MDRTQAEAFSQLVRGLRGELTPREAATASRFAATTWTRWEDPEQMVGSTPSATLLRRLARFAASKEGPVVTEAEIFELVGRPWFPDPTELPDDDDDLAAELEAISRLLDTARLRFLQRKGR